jgi:hypothetical protein
LDICIHYVSFDLFVNLCGLHPNLFCLHKLVKIDCLDFNGFIRCICIFCFPHIHNILQKIYLKKWWVICKRRTSFKIKNKVVSWINCCNCLFIIKFNQLDTLGLLECLSYCESVYWIRIWWSCWNCYWVLYNHNKISTMHFKQCSNK